MSLEIRNTTLNKCVEHKMKINFSKYSVRKSYRSINYNYTKNVFVILFPNTREVSSTTKTQLKINFKLCFVVQV